VAILEKNLDNLRQHLQMLGYKIKNGENRYHHYIFTCDNLIKIDVIVMFKQRFYCDFEVNSLLYDGASITSLAGVDVNSIIYKIQHKMSSFYENVQQYRMDKMLKKGYTITNELPIVMAKF
jgi:hypothetical protein